MSADAIVEGKRVLAAFRAAGIDACLVGGVAVGIICEELGAPPPDRAFEDIDYMAKSGEQERISATLSDLGYEGDRETNLIQGDRRLIFFGRESGLKIDVFIGRFSMCHEVDIRSGRPGLADVTSIVLTKLQIVEMNPKDVKDLLALFGVCEFGRGVDEIDVDRIVGITRKDWGFYTTVTDGLETLGKLAADAPDGNVALGKIMALDEAIKGAEKSRGWRLRDRIGRRKRWYEVPEENEGGSLEI